MLNAFCIHVGTKLLMETHIRKKAQTSLHFCFFFWMQRIIFSSNNVSSSLSRRMSAVKLRSTHMKYLTSSDFFVLEHEVACTVREDVLAPEDFDKDLGSNIQVR